MSQRSLQTTYDTLWDRYQKKNKHNLVDGRWGNARYSIRRLKLSVPHCSEEIDQVLGCLGDVFPDTDLIPTPHIQLVLQHIAKCAHDHDRKALGVLFGVVFDQPGSTTRQTYPYDIQSYLPGMAERDMATVSDVVSHVRTKGDVDRILTEKGLRSTTRAKFMMAVQNENVPYIKQLVNGLSVGDLTRGFNLAISSNKTRVVRYLLNTKRVSALPSMEALASVVERDDVETVRLLRQHLGEKGEVPYDLLLNAVYSGSRKIFLNAFKGGNMSRRRLRELILSGVDFGDGLLAGADWFLVGQVFNTKSITDGLLEVLASTSGKNFKSFIREVRRKTGGEKCDDSMFRRLINGNVINIEHIAVYAKTCPDVNVAREGLLKSYNGVRFIGTYVPNGGERVPHNGFGAHFNEPVIALSYAILDTFIETPRDLPDVLQELFTRRYHNDVEVLRWWLSRGIFPNGETVIDFIMNNQPTVNDIALRIVLEKYKPSLRGL